MGTKMNVATVHTRGYAPRNVTVHMATQFVTRHTFDVATDNLTEQIVNGITYRFRTIIIAHSTGLLRGEVTTVNILV
jgi:actin-like ATPase involved in cell morphogenesis